MSTLADRFLRDTGLPPDATPRDIRKAYARALKGIDQATEPQAFQQLRAAYEAALAPPGQDQVAVAAGGQGGQALTEEVLPPLPEASMREAQEVAADVLAWLPAARWARHDDAERLLMAALADSRLLSLEARQAFEAALASQLAAGWRRGHQHLFTAATEVFGWDRDPARLAGLGRAGRTLDAALQEMQALHRLPIARRSAVGVVVRALQSDSPPGAAFLASRLAEAEACCKAYPNWLQMVARPENLHRWQAQARRAPRWQRTLWALWTRASRTGGLHSSDAALSRQGWRLALAALIGICLLARLLPAGLPHERGAMAQAASGVAPPPAPAPARSALEPSSGDRPKPAKRRPIAQEPGRR